jgi:hypothetical protein
LNGSLREEDTLGSCRLSIREMWIHPVLCLKSVARPTKDSFARPVTLLPDGMGIHLAKRLFGPEIEADEPMNRLVQPFKGSIGMRKGRRAALLI